MSACPHCGMSGEQCLTLFTRFKMCCRQCAHRGGAA